MCVRVGASGVTKTPATTPWHFFSRAVHDIVLMSDCDRPPVPFRARREISKTSKKYTGRVAREHTIMLSLSQTLGVKTIIPLSGPYELRTRPCVPPSPLWTSTDAPKVCGRGRDRAPQTPSFIASHNTVWRWTHGRELGMGRARGDSAPLNFFVALFKTRLQRE